MRIINPHFNDKRFITEWTVSALDTVTLPLDTGYNYGFKIDWGDGSPIEVVTSYNDPNATHTYTNAGTYTQTIDGTCENYYVNSDASIDSKITGLKNWGDIGIKRINFYDCVNMVITATDKPVFAQNADLTQMFRSCTASPIIPEIENWDVSKVQTFTRMFQLLPLFNQDIGGWNMDNASNIDWMFFSCDLFNQNINNWKIGTVTNCGINGLFQGAHAYNQPLNLWDVSAVTDFSNVFNGCTAFNQDVGGWDVSNATDMLSLFSGCSVFNFSLNTWNVTKVTRFDSMFFIANTYNQPMNNWVINTSAPVTMTSMMRANSFNQDLNGWDVSRVTSMNSMFNGASMSFNMSISTWDVSNVTNAWRMFFQNNAYNQDMLGFTWTSVTNMGQFFTSCSTFAGDISNWTFPATLGTVDVNSMFATMSYNGNITGWTTTSFKLTNSMFLANPTFNQNIGSWNMSNVTNCSFMFSNASVFNQDISSWDVSKSVSLQQMFNNAFLFAADISSWVTTANTSLNSTFNDADAFNWDIGGWDTTGVTDMRACFDTNGLFNQDLSLWDVSLVDDLVNFGFLGNFSTANYDLMLIAWEAQTLLSGISWGMQGVKYTAGNVDSGTTDGATTAFKLIQSGQNFLTTVTIGDVVRRSATEYSFVDAIDSDIQLTLSHDIMLTGETYTIEGSAAAKARASMVLNDLWTITDGGAV